MKKLLLVLIFAFGAYHQVDEAAADNNERPKIIWGIQNFIPFFIQDGPFKGEGISDRLMDFFQKHLPQYDHATSNMGFKRILEEASSGVLVCSPLLIKTPEREQSLIYSKPIKHGYDHMFITTTAVKTDQDGYVALEDFIQKHDHPMTIQDGRSYGPVLDKVLSDSLKDNKVVSRYITSEQMFKTVVGRKHGHFIDVEASLTYFRAINPDGIDFKAYPIRGGQSHRFAYAACSRTDEGLQTVTEINEILDENSANEEYRLIIESWIAPENLNYFRKRYEETILTGRG